MSRPTGIVIAALLLAGLGPASAYAQAPGEYDRLIKAAVTEFDAGNYGEARALFQQAHAVQPSARTLRGLGVSAAELRLYVEAVDELEAALAHGTRPLTAEQRAEAERVLQRARLSVARIALTTDPPDARIELDGRAVQLRDGELWVNPGEHTLRARAPGHVPESRVVQAISGSQSMSLVLVPDAPRGAENEPRELEMQQAPAPQRDGEGGSLPALFWAGAAGAAVFGGAALVLHLVAQSEADRIEQECPVVPEPSCSRAHIGRRIDDAGIPTLNVLSGVGLGLACASAVAAGIAFAFDATGDDVQPVSVTVSPQSATLRVMF